MTRRYYTPDLLTAYPSVELAQEEAVHAVRVMRVKVGDLLELFDGQGHQATATVTHVGRRECHCQCEAPRAINREPSTSLELALAMPKPEAAKEMIQRLTELGVARVQPLVFQRTQRPPTDALLGKLERIVIEACKQSGRNHLMKIAPVASFAKWITASDQSERITIEAECGAPNLLTQRFVAMPGGTAMGQWGEGAELPQCSVRSRRFRPAFAIDPTAPLGVVSEARGGRALDSALNPPRPETGRPSQSEGEERGPKPTGSGSGEMQCTIGPEGGLSEEEFAACCRAGMKPIDLGKRILRIETAACLIASRSVWD